MNPLYIAGFLDGEGCFGVIGTSIACRVSNTHKATLEEMAERWGGTVRLHGRPEGNRRTSWQWSVHGQLAEYLIEVTLPYLKEKRPQALLLLEYRRVGPKDPLRAWIKVALGQLKRLETPPSE